MAPNQLGTIDLDIYLNKFIQRLIYQFDPSILYFL